MTALKLTITNWGSVALDKRGLRALMRSAGNDIRTKTRRLISQTVGSGRTYAGGGGAAYRGSYRRGAYRASAPGNPPVQVTGTLRNSLRTYVYPSGEGFAVRERAFYSLFLEVGARGGNPYGGKGQPAKSRAAERRHRRRTAYSTRVLEPRPHLDRVMQQEEPALEKRVRRALADALTWKQTKT